MQLQNPKPLTLEQGTLTRTTWAKKKIGFGRRDESSIVHNVVILRRKMTTYQQEFPSLFFISRNFRRRCGRNFIRVQK